MSNTGLSPETATRLGKLSRLGRWIAALSLTGLLAYGLYLALTPTELRAVLNRGLPGSPNDPSGLGLALAAFAAAIPGGIFAAILALVWKVFQRTGSGNFLDAAFARLLRWLGWLAVASGIASIICHSLVSLLMTKDNPPGQKMLLVEISSSQVAALIMGVLFFMFTHIIAEMMRLDEDNRSII
ncbi:MAG: DUF2975 domain-containing protein [Hyphomicrobiales bacterium]